MQMQLESSGLKITAAMTEQDVWLEPDVKTFKKSAGSLVLVANQKGVDAKKFSDAAMLISGPGEYEKNEVFVYAWQSKTAVQYMAHIDHMSVGFLWAAGIDDFDATLKEEFSSADILVFDFSSPFEYPSGGKKNPGEALAEIVGEIEPRMVVVVGDSPAAGQLLKSLGFKGEAESKFKILKKDLPAEDMKILKLA